ncbi:hypothetical protein [Aliiruegeria lutimaris]|uniref:Uncharacterized protein n=1 Tax=Aliiruegeria lutimaris TaxID=571298 RepID=A0A1G8TZV2_9RHOB|nr:hypothetical protein [Aliiruegeria lutimaris]SDJ47031.1 hypothetical protein SAMN04488026_101811 [Aliiruegeria lutimaris]
MNTRSSKSMVTFFNAFAQPGYPGQLPAGTYEVLVEEELLQGLSFEAWRRISTYLIVHGKGNRGGSIAMRPITQKDLELVLRRDRITTETIKYSEAALSPLEELK